MIHIRKQEKLKFRADQKKYQKYLKKQIRESKRAKREALRKLKEEGAKVGGEALDDDAKFESYVRSTIDEWSSHGKNIIPLQASLVPKDELKSAMF